MRRDDITLYSAVRSKTLIEFPSPHEYCRVKAWDPTIHTELCITAK
jgi:hypothetical protein